MYQEWTQMYSAAIVFLFYSGWVVGWKQINHIYFSFRMAIYHVHLFFFLSLFVTFKVPCIVVRTITFFSPDFFLSKYDTKLMLFLSFCIKMTDFSSRLFTSFSSFGIPFLSRRIFPTIVTFFSNVHSAKDTDVKYKFIEMSFSSMLLCFEISLPRYFVYSSVPVTCYLDARPSVTSVLPAYDIEK